jgi:hypothetical protein
MAGPEIWPPNPRGSWSGEMRDSDVVILDQSKRILSPPAAGRPAACHSVWRTRCPPCPMQKSRETDAISPMADLELTTRRTIQCYVSVSQSG